MEKNIEWFKEEIPKLRGYAVIIDGEGGEWEPVTTVSMEDIYELINQLDKPEVLSSDWIKYNQLVWRGVNGAEHYVPSRKLYGKLVPKQEKVKVPRFVADILEENTFSDLPTAFEELFSTNAGHYYGEDVCKWIVSNDETFARAWLDGFTVEKEQKYYAKVKGWGVNGNDGHVYYSGKFPLSLALSIESVAHTKDEWKNYGVYDGNADFVRVEELEE